MRQAIGMYSLIYDGVVTLGTSVTVVVFTPFNNNNNIPSDVYTFQQFTIFKEL